MSAHLLPGSVETMADLARHLEGRTLILLSNREPYEHVRTSDGIVVRRPAGGLVSALDPTMQRTHGTWVAWGSGNADRDASDDAGRLQVPPEDPSYTLRRVWLDEADVEGFYLAFANSSLWPLCHMLVQHFEYRAEAWERYKAVNLRFAQAVAEEVRRAPGQAMVWVQDYHFALVAGQLREIDPALFIQLFWHIPFPPPDILRLLPRVAHEALLRGLLGNDLIAFHTERYAQNFLACVASVIPDAQVDTGALTIRCGDRTTVVGAFPISIDAEHFDALARQPETEDRVATLRRSHASDGRQLGISVDRVDYTKGIPHRLQALELLWAERPELRQRFSFLLVATPSRTELSTYKRLEEQVIEQVAHINFRFGSPKWTPIILVNQNVDAELLAAIYRAADICLVSSLQDGMNLVAKEFIACQIDERGVLVLSRFAGAAEEVDGAVLINPFNVDGFMAGIRTAIEMPEAERGERMRRMREQLHKSTIFDWLDAILARASALLDARQPPVS